MTHSFPPLLSRAFWVCWAVTSLNVLISAGYSTAALVSQGDSNVYTQYAASRSFALVVVILGVGRFRSPQALLALSAVMTLIQLGDAVIGFQLHDAAKSFGPLGLAVLTFIAALFLLRANRQPLS
ncbi:hypothetical protein [Deinococcus marmoris]|uniref:Integral membrane protein n=1 Tax=Deinococcus marmoris TaxID=249408 RepID=A0A1U7NTB0_9DEIO|nr:hypothetical protein [Deinococcus marmoris]OLV16152.1 hypothetical protein BOO71_0012745 [Deinococcus marmoris]